MAYRPTRAARAVRYVAYSELSFFGMLLVCVALIPRAATGNLGLSFYGTYHTTIIPYTAGMLLAGYYLIKAAHTLPHHTTTLQYLTEALIVLAVLIVGVCLTPYSVDLLFDRAHIATSAVLFLVELLLAGWLVYGACRGPGNVALFAAQIIGALVSMLSAVNTADLMLPGEFVTQLAFGVLLIRCLHQLTRTGAG